MVTSFIRKNNNLIPGLGHELSTADVGFSSWTYNRQKPDQEFVNIYEIFCKLCH